ncbi:Uncharacterized protein APZ42_008134 [Daphnia magna]|uniref:Uncharacterized protein n=1 Tax=Daphnia magna TaxID=35525 RepID=A0A162D105_9CRUS|nr:Uncharacterized protein APZ42_008134 [Daphnia magna]
MYKSYTRTTPARKIDPYLTNKYCTEDELYFGPDFSSKISKDIPDEKDRALLVKCCKNFYITAIVQLKPRFNFDDPLYDLLDFLSPKKLGILLQQAFPTFFKGFLY